MAKLDEIGIGEVLVDVADGVATITLNRPHVLNAFNGAMHTQLTAILRTAVHDPTLRGIILTGSGRAFSGGGDLSWFTSITPDELDLLFAEGRELVWTLLDVDVPVVAAVNGTAVGLGATIALLTDMVVMSNVASIGDPHVRIGVTAGDGGAVIWPWLVGMNRAKESLLTGATMSAVRAHDIGLINRLSEPGEVLAAAKQALAEYLAIPTLAFRGTKRALNSILKQTANLVLDACLASEKECFGTPEHKDLIERFLAKSR